MKHLIPHHLRPRHKLNRSFCGRFSRQNHLGLARTIYAAAHQISCLVSCLGKRKNLSSLVKFLRLSHSVRCSEPPQGSSRSLRAHSLRSPGPISPLQPPQSHNLREFKQKLATFWSEACKSARSLLCRCWQRRESQERTSGAYRSAYAAA